MSAVWTVPKGPSAWTLVYAPGAGSSLTDPFGIFAARILAEHRVTCLRFQFPYSEESRRFPDRPPILEATWEAAIAVARERDGFLAVGGRSMGGRIASQVVARGARVDALALFAYPVHPPGRSTQRRVAHLPAIAVPTLFCSGTNDAFGTPEELREAVASVPCGALHLLEGADHGFRVPKRTGRTREDVWLEAARALIDWLPSAEVRTGPPRE